MVHTGLTLDVYNTHWTATGLHKKVIDIVMTPSSYTSLQQQRILGCLYGQAVGDAFGMPSELWSREKVRAFFGWIHDFLDGPEENIAANEFVRGQFTDDTSQMVALMDAIIEEQGEIKPLTIARHIMKWAEGIDAFSKNILGPTSKGALIALQQGIPLEEIQANGVTNGAPMRIAPIGCLMPTSDKEAFIEAVRLACVPTHKSDIAIAGSVVIAWAISRAIEGAKWATIRTELPPLAQEVQSRFASTFSASLGRRIELAFTAVDKAPTIESGLDDIYDLIGSGMDVIESIPAALGIVELSEGDPMLCAQLCANLGGDTDTIGAMATAICGALSGISALPLAARQLIDQANRIDFGPYAEALAHYRQQDV